MIGDPRKLRGAAALTEIVERLKNFGAEVEKALDGEGASTKSFEADTPFGKMSGQFGLRMGAARRPASSAPPRRPTRTATRQPDPLVDVHFDGVSLIVTTEVDDPGAEVSAQGAQLFIRSARAPERVVALPRAVQPETLRVSIVNGVLEATMTPQEPSE